MKKHFFFWRWLEKKAYDVKFTKHLENVLSIIKEFDPQLIIIDIDQKEIIPLIKNYAGNLPLLVMTGYTYHGAYSDLPVGNTIEKPFTLKLLEKK